MGKGLKLRKEMKLTDEDDKREDAKLKPLYLSCLVSLNPSRTHFAMNWLSPDDRPRPMLVRWPGLEEGHKGAEREDIGRLIRSRQ